jgi:hypothetical protein
MIRRYNYKRKKEITQSMYAFSVEEINSDFHLKVDNLDITSLNHDPDFEVKIFVWVTGSVKKKIELGTVGNLELNPVKEYSRLPFIRKGITHKVRGEIGIVDPKNGYLKKTTSSEIIIKEFDILASKDSLLPVQYYDLNEKPWSIQFNENEELPILQLNEKLREVELVEYIKGKGKLIQSLIIYPAFKEILRRIVIVEGKSSPSNCDQEWMRAWLDFANRVDSSRVPEFDIDNPSFEEVEEWIDSVSDSLSRRGDFIESIKKDIERSIGG